MHDLNLSGDLETNAGELGREAGGGAGMIILDISDVAHPRKIGQLSMSPPFASSIGVHTVVPVPDKGIAFVNSEAIAEDCKEPLQQASIVDVADPAKPRLMAMFPLPLPPADWPIKSFCERGGRFGPHNQNTLLHNPFVQPQGSLVYLTYFNAGLRIYDVSTPTARGRLFPAARSDPSLWGIPEGQAGGADRGRAGRHPRLHLHHRQEPGIVHPETYRQVTAWLFIGLPTISPWSYGFPR